MIAQLVASQVERGVSITPSFEASIPAFFSIVKVEEDL